MRELVMALDKANRLFIQYIDSLFEGQDDAASGFNEWKQNTQNITDILLRINAGWSLMEWIALLAPEQKLLMQVIDDAQTGHYDTLPDNIPSIHKLSMAIAAYMTKGLLEIED